MGRKWGSNEGIHIGDIFKCNEECAWYCPYTHEEYYQVVALRGRTQVVLNAIRSEICINEGIAEDSPVSWHRRLVRPLPGQFMSLDEMPYSCAYEKDGKWIRFGGDRVTAWVSPERTPDGRLLLREVGELAVYYLPAQSKDWEPWDAETIQKMEEYCRARDEVVLKYGWDNKEAPWPEYPL